jgi:hypothetical protein
VRAKVAETSGSAAAGRAGALASIAKATGAIIGAADWDREHLIPDPKPRSRPGAFTVPRAGADNRWRAGDCSAPQATWSTLVAKVAPASIRIHVFDAVCASKSSPLCSAGRFDRSFCGAIIKLALYQPPASRRTSMVILADWGHLGFRRIGPKNPADADASKSAELLAGVLIKIGYEQQKDTSGWWIRDPARVIGQQIPKAVAVAAVLDASTAGSGEMYKIEWYRERAADCAHQATRVTNEQAKAVMKDMADAWSGLAELQEKRHAKISPMETGGPNSLFPVH